MLYNYSFIIPHKNCPDLLQRCVDSIPERDDVQVIVVDDNSEEGKKPSLKERKNLQVILLDAEHSKGAGRARNVGLEHAVGKWLLFADADDYYTKEYLGKILQKYEQDIITDMVFINARMFNEKNETKALKLNSLIDSYENNVVNAEIFLRYNFWTPWSRMIKRNIVSSHNVVFDETMARNDKNFVLECSVLAKTIAVEPIMAYNYFRPSFGSQTDRKRTVALLDDMIQITSRTNNIYERARYQYRYSYLQLFWHTTFVNGMKKKDIFCKYLSALYSNKTNLFIDVVRFLKNKYKNKL